MKFKPIAKIEINGEDWEIGYGHPGVTKGKINDGICRYAKRRIVINRRAGRSLLNVLAHETIHARLPDLDEDSVETTANLIEQVYNIFSEQPSRHGRG